MRPHTSLVTSASALLALTTITLAAPPQFDVELLGTLGGPQSAAFGLNDHGHVVGWADNGLGQYTAFKWDGTTMLPLGTLPGTLHSTAEAINNDGVIVGLCVTPQKVGELLNAFRYADGSMSAFEELSEFGSVAHDVNQVGEAVGYALNEFGQETACRWRTGGEIVDESALSPHQRQRITGVNNGGIMVGWEYTPLAGPSDAFAYDGANWVQIGGFQQFQNAEAYDINDNFVIAGTTAVSGSGDWTAVLWVPDGGHGVELVDIGTIPNHELSFLYDVNNSDHAVGAAQTFNPVPASRAIYWDGVELHDLNDLVPGLQSGVIWEAREINENGQIAVSVYVPGVGFEAALLTPMTDVCAGDLDGSGAVSFDDLLAVLAAWGPCPGCPADFDGSGDVGFSDALVVLSNWGPCS